MENSLEGKIVAITGAGGVICGEIARTISRYNARVALLDRNYESAKKIADEIGDNARPYECDVLSKESIEAAHDAINRDFGAVDILINGAGGNSPRATTDNEFASVDCETKKDFFALSEDGVKWVFDLNFMGTFLPCQVFARDMMGRMGTSILNISSMNAFAPLTKIPAYSGAKAAVSNLTKWLAVHFAKVGIRVNAIAPGFFVTTQNRSLLYDGDGKPTDRTNKILTATPMGRFGEIDELMGGVLLLTSDMASFITGVVLPIDGGFNAYSGV